MNNNKFYFKFKSLPNNIFIYPTNEAIESDDVYQLLYGKEREFHYAEAKFEIYCINLRTKEAYGNYCKNSREFYDNIEIITNNSLIELLYDAL